MNSNLDSLSELKLKIPTWNDPTFFHSEFDMILEIALGIFTIVNIVVIRTNVLTTFF